MRSFRWLAAVTAVCAYFQISLGGVVRVSGSGLGCSDQWPPCKGSILPPFEIHAVIEYAHRIFGATTSFLMLAAAVLAWLVFRRTRPAVAWLATAALAVVALEIPLGALVVFKALSPILVLAHLSVALAILGLLIAAAVLAGPAREAALDGARRRRLWIATGLTYVVLFTGSTVVASGADELCHAWPLCGSGLQPDFAGADAYTMLHRLTVGVVGLLVLLILAETLRGAGAPSVRIAALLSMAGFVVQAAVGAGGAVSGSSPLFDGLHVALGSAVWAGVVATTCLALPRRLRATTTSRTLQLERRPA